MSNEILLTIAKNCPKIEVLDVSSCMFADLSVFQPNPEYFNHLKILQLSAYNARTPNFIPLMLDFFIVPAKKLEFLDLVSISKSDFSVDQYIRHLLDLQLLDNLKALILNGVGFDLGEIDITRETFKEITELPSIRKINAHQWGFRNAFSYIKTVES